MWMTTFWHSVWSRCLDSDSDSDWVDSTTSLLSTSCDVMIMNKQPAFEHRQLVRNFSFTKQYSFTTPRVLNSITNYQKMNKFNKQIFLNVGQQRSMFEHIFHTHWSTMSDDGDCWLHGQVVLHQLITVSATIKTCIAGLVNHCSSRVQIYTDLTQCEWRLMPLRDVLNNNVT